MSDLDLKIEYYNQGTMNILQALRNTPKGRLSYDGLWYKEGALGVRMSIFPYYRQRSQSLFNLFKIDLFVLVTSHLVPVI